MPNTIVDNCLQRQARMEIIRQDYEDLKTKSCKWVNPRRYDYQQIYAKGKQRRTQMYDGTAQDAFLSWVDGMLAWLVSDAHVWFGTYIPQRRIRTNDAIIRFCQQYSEQMLYEFREGNFYSVNPEFLRDGASVGDATMFTEESENLGYAVHEVPHPGTIWIAQDKEGRVNVVHRKLSLTSQQARLNFAKPTDRLGAQLVEWSKDPAKSQLDWEFLHVICPTDDHAIFTEGRVVKDKPWASVYIQRAMKSQGQTTSASTANKGDGDVLVRVKGFDYFPPTVWRFRRNSDELYGYSPAMDVMCDIEAAQQLGKDLLHMGHVAATGIWNVPDEQRTEFSALPAARNYYTDPRRIATPAPMAGQYPIAKDRQDVILERIQHRYGYQFWYALTILAQKKERVTASEVMELQAERGMMLVPQVDNLVRDGYVPIFNNVAHIAESRLPEAPEELLELVGQNIVELKMIGPLAQSQDLMFKGRGLKQGLQMLTGFAQAVAQAAGPQAAADIMDAVDEDQTAEYIWESVDAPEILLRPRAERLARRQARQQAAAAQAQAQMAREMAAAGASASKSVEPNSPMAALMGA